MMAARIAITFTVPVALVATLALPPPPAMAESVDAADAYAVDLGDGTAQGYVIGQNGASVPDGPPYVISPMPAPEPAPVPAVVRFPRGADVTPLLSPAAARWGADAAYLRCLGYRESRLGTDPATYLAWRTHRGPFQFDRGTWAEQAPRHGLSGAWEAALDPWSNVELAAALVAQGQDWRWSTRQWCR